MSLFIQGQTIRSTTNNATTSTTSLNTALTTDVKQTMLMDVSEMEIDNENTCGIAVSMMDKRYNTGFYEWIKNESNSDYIANHLKRIIDDYDTNKLVYGLRWLFQDWSVRASATVLIKLFYERGVDQPQFARLVNEILAGKPWKQVEEMVIALVIGEQSDVVAKFVYFLTETWEPTMIADLISSISTRSHWSNEYIQEVIQMFAGMTTEDLELKNKRVQAVQQKFSQRAEALLATAESGNAVLDRQYALTFKHFAHEVLLKVAKEQFASRRSTKLRNASTSPLQFIKIENTRTPESILSSPLAVMSPTKYSPISPTSEISAE